MSPAAAKKEVCLSWPWPHLVHPEGFLFSPCKCWQLNAATELLLSNIPHLNAGEPGASGVPGSPAELKTLLSQKAFLKALSLYSLDSLKVLTYLLRSALGFVCFR